VLRCEQLDDRIVPSTLRMATYNIEADINGVTTPRPALYQVLEGIGEQVVQGHNQALDVLTLQETTSNTTTVDPIVSALNSHYAGIATYARSPYQATQSGSNSSGNGPNAIVYSGTTLTLLESVGVGTPQGSTNGEYRQVARYKFQAVTNPTAAGQFYVYVAHSKAGTGSTNANLRNLEAQISRNDEATLPADARVLYTGDFNLDASTDASYQTLAAASSPSGVSQGAASDPLNRPGNWALNSAFQDIETESATNLRSRDDFLLVTQNVNTAAAGGLGYAPGTYHTFGVNGTTAINGTVNSGSNTSFNGNLVQNGPTLISGSTLLSDLTTASDHLPVVADFTIPDGPPRASRRSGRSRSAPHRWWRARLSA
jgi:endonuclease/exonuclease/phosphatase family metal-dependent hydrolase